MFAKQYSHRLPADYDMGVIRRRAAQLGPLWDNAEGLLFKVFIAQEHGGNVYSSVYLWADPLQAADFLLGERFQKVLDSFGRPHVESWLPLDVQRGPAQGALSLYREEWPLAPEAPRAAWAPWALACRRGSAPSWPIRPPRWSPSPATAAS